jgi:TRAP-type mannitol/chloroaromatic compound transport system permease small subunit
MKFSEFFSSAFEASSKRLAFLILVAVFIIQHFLLMYIKIEIANKELVKESQWYLFLLICLLGGFITAELFTRLFTRKAELEAQTKVEQAKAGQPGTKVEVNTDNINVTNKTE